MKFVRNLAAFTDALGVENAPTVMFMSMLPFKDDESRNDFIKDLTDISMTELRTYGD